MNVVRQCADFGDKEGCHGKWESAKKRRSLANYEELMGRVKQMDESYYEQLKLNEERWL